MAVRQIVGAMNILTLIEQGSSIGGSGLAGIYTDTWCRRNISGNFRFESR